MTVGERKLPRQRVPVLVFNSKCHMEIFWTSTPYPTLKIAFFFSKNVEFKYYIVHTYIHIYNYSTYFFIISETACTNVMYYVILGCCHYLPYSELKAG